MRKSWLISLIAAGALIVSASQVSAHGGIDDGDDGEEGEGGGQVQGGTPLEELYPGYYAFQREFVTFDGTFARIQAANGARGVTATTPSGQPAIPFASAPITPPATAP